MGTAQTYHARYLGFRCIRCQLRQSLQKRRKTSRCFQRSFAVKKESMIKRKKSRCCQCCFAVGRLSDFFYLLSLELCTSYGDSTDGSCMAAHGYSLYPMCISCTKLELTTLNSTCRDVLQILAKVTVVQSRRISASTLYREVVWMHIP